MANLITQLHYRWPFARGQWRLINTLAHTRLAPLLKDVPFRSRSGVRLKLDIATMHFLHLSGRLTSEPLELAVACRIVRQGDTFVDVGAHWGLYVPHILGVLGTSGAYYAIEPDSDNCALLQKTFSGSGENLRICHSAAADYDGTSWLCDAGSSEAFLSTLPGGKPVTVARLDSLLADLQPNRAVIIKIDTEGSEAAVIRGCAGLVAHWLRPIFIIEYLHISHGQTRQDINNAIGTVFGTDYLYFAIDYRAGGLQYLGSPDTVEAHVRNILALPPEEIGRLHALGKQTLEIMGMKLSPR